MIDLHLQRYALFALSAAALFGASTPLAKLLLTHISPLVLAGLLYLGSGIGLLIIAAGKKHLLKEKSSEAVLRRSDYAWLAAAVASGGVLAPVLLLWGLSGASASGTSLLLNLEGVMTALLAALIFREAVGIRLWLAAFIMLAASLLLSYEPGTDFSASLSSAAVAGACFLWALDNNLTRNISHADPTGIAIIKGLVAGSVNLSLGYVMGAQFPAALHWIAAMLLGLLSYGVSLVLFIYALRHLGSARTSAHFSTAPFLGAGISIALLGEPLSAAFLTAFVLMLLATWLVLTEQHEHDHAHGYLSHTHRHSHDTHHQHQHEGNEGQGPHTHPHVHEPLTHSHPHLPDIHHRHEH